MYIYHYICESYYETKINHHEAFHLSGLLAVCLTACSNDESLIAEMPENLVPESQNPNMRTPDEAVEVAERGLNLLDWKSENSRSATRVRRKVNKREGAIVLRDSNPGRLMIPNILFML